MPTNQYDCLLRCGWTYETQAPTGPPGDDALEAAISEHFQTHTPQDWATAHFTARTEIERLRAGEEPHHDDYTQATPAQWIWHWNQATPEQRLQMAASIQRASAAESRCFMGDHASLRERNGQLRQALTRGLVLANELIPVSNTVGIGRRLWEALELRASDVADGDPMTQVGQGAPSDATGDSGKPPAPASNPDDLRNRVADAIINALKTRTFLAEAYYPGGPRGGWGLTGHDLADVALGELRNELAELRGLRVGLAHLEQMEQASAVLRPDDCGPACAITHLYDGSCTVDPALEDVIGGGRDNGRVTWCWRCAEDDGCGHLSLGHTTAAAARRSYDRHRAKECPRTDPFDTPTTPADGGLIDAGSFTAVAIGRDGSRSAQTTTVNLTIDGRDIDRAVRKHLQVRPRGGEQE